MRRWHPPTLEGSSDKRTERAAGADAPRKPSIGSQEPRVLFSAPECRAVVIDLRAGEELGDHRVRERALVTSSRDESRSTRPTTPSSARPEQS
jgi:hypothetical protein